MVPEGRGRRHARASPTRRWHGPSRTAGMEAGHVRILALIETPLGIARCEDDPALGARPHASPSIFGARRLLGRARRRPDARGARSSSTAARRVVVAARAAGLVPPIDGPYLELEDLEGLVATAAARARSASRAASSSTRRRSSPCSARTRTLTDEEVDRHPPRRRGVRGGRGRGRRLDPGRRPLRRLPDLLPGEGADRAATTPARQRRSRHERQDTAAARGPARRRCASLFAGPVIGTMLGDYGADVIKVEHPRATTCARSAGRRTASRSGGRSSAATSAR